MLLRCIRAESRKLHASPVWLMFLLLPTLSAGYGTFNYLQNLDILSEGWYSLWTQHTLFTRCCFSGAGGCVCGLPLAAGTPGAQLEPADDRPCAAVRGVLCQVRGGGPAGAADPGADLSALPAVRQGLCPPGGLAPGGDLLVFDAGVLGGLPVAAAQLLLSMLVRGFAAPVLWALMGGVAGMLAASRGLGLWWPYALMQLGMNSNRSEDLLSGSMGSFVLASLVWLLAFLTAAACLLEKRDVKA